MIEMVVNILQVERVEDRRLLEEAGELLAVVVEGPGDQVVAYFRCGDGGLVHLRL